MRKVLLISMKTFCTIPLRAVVLSALCCGFLFARGGSQAVPLEGAIDFHAHCSPDSIKRSIDAVGLARLAKSEGMQALVLKNHYEPTASWAYFARKAVPGIEIFGGIALNRSVGGMNPAAVENMAKVEGGYGRVVWMTTFDSRAQVLSAKEHRPFVAVSENGRLLPETVAVIAVIAKYHLVLATGHNTPQEDLLLIREAKKQGVQRIVVTHAMMAPIHMSIAEMKEAAGMGAYIEFVYNGLIGHYKEFDFTDYAKAIRAVGPEHCILASDLGQTYNPVHTVGLKAFYVGLLKAGIQQSEINLMAKKNPAWLLNLN
jgi:hypothetical protein